MTTENREINLSEVYGYVDIHNIKSDIHSNPDALNTFKYLLKDNSVIIFHHNDNDGTLAAVTAGIFNGIYWNNKKHALLKESITDCGTLKNMIFIQCSYISGRRWVDYMTYIKEAKAKYPNSFLAINAVDLSLNDATLFSEDNDAKFVLSKYCKYWIDHHLDTKYTVEHIKLINPYSEPRLGKMEVVFNENYSGALLSYLFFRDKINSMEEDVLHIKYPFPVDRTVYDLVDARDRFFKESFLWEDATNFHIVSGMYPTSPTDEDNLWLTILYGSKTILHIIVKEGSRYKSFKDSMYARSKSATCIKLHDVEINGNKYNIIAMNTVGNSDVFLGEDLEEEWDFCSVYYFTGKEYKYSIFTNKDTIRSNGEDLDLQKIAAYFGGGGHKKAAGFTSKYNIFDNINFNMFMIEADKDNHSS